MIAKSIHEPARDVPVHGEYDVVVLGGGPAGIAAAASAAALGRKTLMVERYGFLGRHGHGRRRHQFLRTACQRARRASPGGAWHRRRTARAHRPARRPQRPHVVFGKIQAQAYDTAAYKCAADDLLLSHGADILFHTLGAGVVMDAAHHPALIVETKSGRAAIVGRRLHRLFGRRRSRCLGRRAVRAGDGDGGMLYPTMMFRLNGVDPAAARRGLEHHSGRDG